MINKNKIEEVVSEWCSKDIPFTAFDVTKYLRNKGEVVRHTHVNTFVKELHRNEQMWDQNDINTYEATIVAIPGVNPSPFLYHPVDYDISNYDPNWVDSYDPFSNFTDVTDVTDVTDPSIDLGMDVGDIVSSNSSSTPSGSNSSTTKCKVVATDIDGRLNVPQKLLPDYPVIYCKVNYNYSIQLKIPRANDFQTSSSYLLRRNKDGRLRLNKTILKKLSPKPNRFMVVYNKNTQTTTIAIV